VLFRIGAPTVTGAHTLQKYAQFINQQNRTLQISLADGFHFSHDGLGRTVKQDSQRVQIV
jgi:hypothetical protein